MVDINLFKEEEEEKEGREWETPREEEDTFGHEATEGMGGFDEDLPEQLPLDDEEILGDEEAVPEFEEPEEGGHYEDYEYGEGRERRGALWFWVFLGVVLVGAALYFFVFQPRRQAQVVEKTTSPEAGAAEEPVVEEEPTQETPASVPERVAAVVDSGTVGVSRSVSNLVQATKPVFENLSHQGQFGAILLEGDRFFVEYVSETPGVAQAMGHRIQTLLGGTGFTVSPEERHTTAGKVYYWGVISGELPEKASMEPGMISSGPKRFANPESFVEAIRGLVGQHRLAVRGTQVMSEVVEAGVRQKPVRIKIEGNKQGVLSFLESLRQFQGNYGLSKLLLVPSNYSNFKAEQVKLVLDFWVAVG